MKIIIVALVLICSFSTFAQNVKPIKATVAAKNKAPKFTLSLAGFKDTVYISPKVADSIIGMPLKISETKNGVFNIIAYQFLYRKFETTEDENTGKASRTSSIKVTAFKTTPISSMWLNFVRDRILPGEEILFFDVVVKDAQGKNYYAPNLKFIIQ